MINFWRKVFGFGAQSRESRRDPDLDLVKHMVENHELKLQELDRELDIMSGGTRQRTERRAIPRPPRH